MNAYFSLHYNRFAKNSSVNTDLCDKNQSTMNRQNDCCRWLTVAPLSLTILTPEKSGGFPQFKTTVLNNLRIPKGQIVEFLIVKQSAN